MLPQGSKMLPCGNKGSANEGLKGLESVQQGLSYLSVFMFVAGESGMMTSTMHDLDETVERALDRE